MQKEWPKMSIEYKKCPKKLNDASVDSLKQSL